MGSPGKQTETGGLEMNRGIGPTIGQGGGRAFTHSRLIGGGAEFSTPAAWDGIAAEVAVVVRAAPDSDAAAVAPRGGRGAAQTSSTPAASGSASTADPSAGAFATTGWSRPADSGDRRLSGSPNEKDSLWCSELNLRPAMAAAGLLGKPTRPHNIAGEIPSRGHPNPTHSAPSDTRLSKVRSDPLILFSVPSGNHPSPSPWQSKASYIADPDR